MPLAEAFALTFTGPIFITVLSIPVLDETVGLRRWTGLTHRALAVGISGHDSKGGRFEMGDYHRDLV